MIQKNKFQNFINFEKSIFQKMNFSIKQSARHMKMHIKTYLNLLKPIKNIKKPKKIEKSKKYLRSNYRKYV